MSKKIKRVGKLNNNIFMKAETRITQFIIKKKFYKNTLFITQQSKVHF